MSETTRHLAGEEARIYEAVLSTYCRDCRAEPGQICTTIGGNPRNGFHARRIRAAIQLGKIRRSEYGRAYSLTTNTDLRALESAGVRRARR